MEENRWVRLVVMLALGCEPIGGAGAPLSVLDCPAGTNIVEGTGGNDTLEGTSGADCIIGYDGDDVIDGLGGDDFIAGGAGNDILHGAQGDDDLYGEAGDDELLGEQGNDRIDGGDGSDRLTGGNGSDVVDGGDGDDELGGDNGSDVIAGGPGDDVITGGGGSDHVSGGEGNDVIAGGNGGDTVDGGEGNDVIVGGRAGDVVDGGGGTDSCDGAGCEGDEALPTCGSDGDCTTDRCIGGFCVFCIDDVECDDASFCNGVERCVPSNGCVSGTPPSVDDGVACTDDACDDGARLIRHVPDHAACGDADPCTADVCEGGGCDHAIVADGTACNDGDPATTGEQCVSGVCAPAFVARFSVAPPAPVCGQAVLFDSSASSPPPGRVITRRSWDFDGDGVFDLHSTATTATWTYARLQSYAPRLVISDDNVPPQSAFAVGAVDAAAADRPPAASITPIDSAIFGDRIVLDGAGSFDPDAPCGDRIVEYQWDLDGDFANDFESANSRLELDVATYSAFGWVADTTATATLTVVDTLGRTGRALMTISIVEPPTLTARFTVAPSAPFCGQAVAFDSSESTAAIGRRIVRRRWDFDGDGVFDLDTTAATATWTYPRLQVYSPTLVVIDDQEPPRSDIEVRTVDAAANNRPPVAPGRLHTVTAGSPLRIDATGAFDQDAACGDRIVEYAWDIDRDGTFELTTVTPYVDLTAEMLNAAGLGTPGNYSVMLRVTDTLGLGELNAIPIRVTPP